MVIPILQITKPGTERLSVLPKDTQAGSGEAGLLPL